MDIHSNIKEKLDYFIKQKKIPNIIFHGVSGSGKNHIVNDFIHKIYNGDKQCIQTYVMHVNCAHGKGIRFVREDLKFFSKTNVDLKDGEIFKTIVLLNADKLTIDAQSAIRRCIELFSRSTRFFIIIEDKYKLLKPILSRFCEIYVPEPVINNCITNLHTHSLNSVYGSAFKEYDNKHNTYLKTVLNKFIKTNASHDMTVTAVNVDENNGGGSSNDSRLQECTSFIIKLYEKGYSGLDLMDFIEKTDDSKNPLKKWEQLMLFDKVKTEFRSEKMFMTFILSFSSM